MTIRTIAVGILIVLFFTFLLYGVSIMEFLQQMAWFAAGALVFIAILWWAGPKLAQRNTKGLVAKKDQEAHLVSELPKVKFSDVGGLKETVKEFEQTIEFLKNPGKFHRLGARIPKGILLVGPPGTGKSLLAKALAGEAHVPFFSTTGSEFVEMYVGVGPARVRELFELAGKNSPSIIFIDEIDSLGRRDNSLNQSSEHTNTINQMLSEMDGFIERTNVIVVGATNRLDLLDPALVRPGRFDRRVFILPPDREGRLEILKIHIRNRCIPIDEADLPAIEELAKVTSGLTGSDLANILNEAALTAAKYSRDKVTKADIEEGFDRAIMGTEKRIKNMTEKDKLAIAFHEAGHTFLAYEHRGITDPLNKVSIISRGMALGITSQISDQDRYLYTRQYLEVELEILMGGRAAEEVFLNVQTSGASDDINKATHLATRMVREFGMSGLGPRTFIPPRDSFFINEYGDKTSIQIDSEIAKLLNLAYDRARTALSNSKDKIKVLVQELMEKETLYAADIDRILN